MNGVIIAIWPIALLIMLAIAGIPLWMIRRHRQATPGYREARAHCRAQQPAAPSAATISDSVTTEPVPAVDGLTIVRKTGSADEDGVAVPAQRHG